MATERLQTIGALGFFVRFLFFATVLSLVWEQLSGPYWQSLLPAVNGLLEASLPPSARLENDGQWMRLILVDVAGATTNLRFVGPQIIHLQAVPGVALFAATPGLSYRALIGWIAAISALLWASQVWILYEGVALALADYGAKLTAHERTQWLQTGWPTATEPGSMYSWWNMWGGLALVMLAWITAHGRRLLPSKR